MKDDETGFYYCHARYYDPKLCKWISADPILEKYLMGKPAGGVYSPDNINLYNYVGNNPIKYFDPNGKNKASYGYATMEQIIDMTLPQ